MNEHDEYETLNKRIQHIELMIADLLTIVGHHQNDIDALQDYIFQQCPDLSKQKLKRNK